ncbi:MAG TPA: FtsQ-type POTRA domain-containing protein [Acidimicrobiales bacterium]
MKLFGRKKAEALAAGTVPADEVFAEPAEEESPAVAADASGSDPSAAGADPITAPVPVVGGAGEAGATLTVPPPPKLRFGFGEGEGVLPPAVDTAAVAPVVTATATGTAAAPALAGEIRKVVTIGFEDDLEQIETTSFDPSPVDLPRPGVDPRLRARRIQVRRDEGRKRLRWALVAGVVAALLIGAGLVLESPVFSVNDVEVTGAAYTDPVRLQQVVADLDGASLLGADLGRAEATLAADPWVKRVRVERRPLRGVRIEIVERVPATTYMGTDQRWRVLDADGRVLAVLDPPGSKPTDPLELTLAAPGPDLEPGATVPAALAGASSIIPRLPADLRARTCSLGVSEVGRLQMTMCDGFVIDLGSPERLRDKLVTTIFVLNTRAEDVAASSGLNVGDPERPVLIQK